MNVEGGIEYPYRIQQCLIDSVRLNFLREQEAGGPQPGSEGFLGSLVGVMLGGSSKFQFVDGSELVGLDAGQKIMEAFREGLETRVDKDGRIDLFVPEEVATEA